MFPMGESSEKRIYPRPRRYRHMAFAAWCISMAVWGLLTGAATSFWCGCAMAATAVRSAQDGPDEGKPSLGPRQTDFDSQGFKICKVVRNERTLNALGIAARLRRTRRVGNYAELPKRLDPSQAGEQFIVTWKYSGKIPHRSTAVKFECKFLNEDDAITMTWDYPDLRRKRYRLLIENIGEDFRRRGRVEYWRVSIFADGELVARKESFLWPVFRGEEQDLAKEEVSPQPSCDSPMAHIP